MLSPQDRRLLLDALRPPDGYALDFAVGTTYSLDLLALLTAPLAFTMFDWQDAEGRPTADPLATLEALRRYADRVSLFCQAGQIVVPKQHRILFGYLEESVFEVVPPVPTASFHAKFWALRFTAADEPVRYRILCLSRNLTFDRSWDTALVLDGSVSDRKNAFAGNHPLGEFVEALPQMTTRPVPAGVQTRIELCAHELRRVAVELPAGFDEVSYWPLGLGGRKVWPFEPRYSRILVVSPFISDGFLGRLADSADERVLVSRLESLQETNPASLADFDPVYALSPAADVEETNAVGEEADDSSGSAQEEITLTGLHAKLFIAERGWNASVFTGSANATSAAFGGNVEFLIELVGKKGLVGIDAFLKKSDGGLSFFDLLQPYTPDPAAVPSDPVQQELDERVEAVRRLLASSWIEAVVTRLPGQELFDVALTRAAGGGFVLPADVTVHCWPITLAEGGALAVLPAGSVAAAFQRLSFTALTTFYAFRVIAADRGRESCARFVVTAPLIGAPTDRRDRILRTLLSNPEQVLRFLLFLLAEFGTDGGGMHPEAESLGTAGGGRWGPGGLPLFEMLVKALDQSPTKLDQVARLVEDLRKGGAGLLPDGFDEIWEPVWAARERGHK